jgi:hypothetical protein
MELMGFGKTLYPSYNKQKGERRSTRPLLTHTSVRYFVTWPRISPPLFASVWTLT